MTLKVKIRQTVEFIVEVDDREPSEVEYFKEQLARGEVDVNHNGVEGFYDVLLTEVLEEKHEINYVVGADLEREVYQLEADGEVVFEDRSHNEVVREWGRRTGNEVKFTSDGREYQRGDTSVWFDYGDPDRSWDIMRESKERKANEKA